MSIPEKYELLEQGMQSKNKLAVAFSGGTDSTYLLYVAHKVLKDQVVAITIKTPYISGWETDEAIDFCKSNQISHTVISADIIPGLDTNPENRCYLCKKHLFGLIKSTAASMNISHVADGSNADDSNTYRPGMKALHELSVNSPLLEAGLTKAEIRILSTQAGLPTGTKPAYSCLLTRIPYNTSYTTAVLRRIEKAENFLSGIGFAGSRVRTHGNLARIETTKERIGELMQYDQSGELSDYFKKIGFEHITVDLEGYRSGSFDNFIKNIKNG